MHKIVIALNSSWNIINFRSGLIKALIEEGYDVIAVAPEDKYSPLIQEMGCRYISIPTLTSAQTALIIVWVSKSKFIA